MDIADIHKTGKALATELTIGTGDVWTYVAAGRGHNPADGPSRWCSIMRGDGLELTLSPISGKPQVHISQPFHTDAWKDTDGGTCDPRQHTPGGGREALPSINVAASKPIAVIAKDVWRRIMPEAEAMHAKALERVAEFNASHAKRESFGDAMGCDASNINSHRTRRIYTDNTPDGVGTVEIEASSSGIQITIGDMSIERAKAVLEALGLSDAPKPPKPRTSRAVGRARAQAVMRVLRTKTR